MRVASCRRWTFTGAMLVGLAFVAPAAADPPRLDPSGDPLPPGAVMRLGSLRYRSLSGVWPNRRYLADGRTVLSMGFGQLCWFDIDSGRMTDSWVPAAGHWLGALSRDGRWLLSRDPQNLRLWDVSTRREVRSLQPSSPLGNMMYACFSPDGRHSATLDRPPAPTGYRLRFWDMASGREMWRIDNEVDPGATEILGFGPGGRAVITFDRLSNSVSVVDGQSGQVVRTFPTVPKGDRGPLGISPDGTAILMGSQGPEVRLWDTETGQKLESLGGHSQGNTTFGFSADGSLVVTGGADPFVLIREWPSGRLRQRVELGHGIAGCHGITPGGRRLEFGLPNETTVRQWDLIAGREIPIPEGHQQGVFAARFLPDGTLQSVGADNTIRVWNPTTGRVVRQSRLSLPDAEPFAVAVSEDGRLMATVSGGQDQRARLTDLRTSREIRAVPTGFNPSGAVALTPDSRLLAVGSHGTGLGGPEGLRLWDASTGRQLRDLSDKAAAPLAFSPDGRLLAAGLAGSLRIWDTTTGRLVMTIGGPIDGVGFSPDGRVLACLTRKIEVVLYEIASRQERLRTPSPGARWITVFRGMIRFSPDGLWLASSGGDGAELWDAATGQLARPLSGGQGKVTDLSFSPDSRTVATAGSDTTILIWAVPERPPAAPLSSKDADTAWADLAADAATAYRAIHRLADDPARAAPFLAERLRLAPVPDPGQVARWVADLGDDRYPVREKATRELEAAGDHAETALRRLLAGRPTLEQRRRAERLLDRLGGPVTAPDRLREVRAVEALERMNTPDARRALEALAKGPAELMLTREAATALGRLRR